MAAQIDATPADAFSRFLRHELMLNPARWRRMLRMTAGATIVIAIAMTFRIPLPAYAAYLVFLVNQEDAASTLVTAIGGTLAATLAISGSLLFYVFDAAEPALRLPLLALSTFAGSFFSRTSTLGPVAFLSGYVLVLTQTLADDTPATEPLTHGVLWLWVVVALPVAVTVVMNLLFGENPVALSRGRAADLFERVATLIESPSSQSAKSLREELLALAQLKNKALRWDKHLKAFAQEDEALIALLLEIMTIAPELPAQLSSEHRRAYALGVRDAGEAFLRRRQAAAAFDVAHPRRTYAAKDHPASAALTDALDQLLYIASGKPPNPVAPVQKQAHTLLVPDAFRNRAHARFAIKVMVAVLASYATYTLLDWPGTRTAVTTCFFVSLTTFGESMHKFTLRASGAIVGGLMAGLCIVFVLPMLTDIGQLCVLIALVSLFCAWIATSSEVVAYAGLQVAFAFFLGILQGDGPATDLTGLRDRVVGILIGNFWVTLVFALVWPASALDQARALRDGVLKKLSRMLGQDANAASQRMDVFADLSHADVLQARGSFEWLRMAVPHTATLPALQVEHMTAMAFTLMRLREASGVAADHQDALLAKQLAALSEHAAAQPAEIEADAGNVNLLAHARRLLEEAIRHAQHSN